MKDKGRSVFVAVAKKRLFNLERWTLNFEPLQPASGLAFADNAEVHLHCISGFYEQ
jgi:hypothetical protein